VSVVVVAISLGAVPGCLDEGDVTAINEQGLYVNASTMHPNAGTARVDIPVCWENPNDAPGSSAQARRTWRDDRRRAVDESWGRFARINFTGWDGTSPSSPTACTAGAPGLHIRICSTPTDPLCPILPDSQAEPGGWPVDAGLDNGIRLNQNHPARILVHEIGHALGFYHAEERPDVPADVCDDQFWSNSNPVMYGAYDADSVMSYCSPPTTTPWISPNDVAAIQRSYGRRITAQLVTARGNCLAANHADGAGDPAFVWDCDEAFKDQELYDAAAATTAGFFLRHYAADFGDALCLTPTALTHNAQVAITACGSTSPWRFQDVGVVGFGGLCMDVQAGNTAPGTPIQMWECGAFGGTNQRFTRTTAGTLRYAETTMCARVGTDNLLALAMCNTSDPRQKFSFTNSTIQRSDTGACLDVTGPSDAEYITGHGGPANGQRIQALTCNGSLNQRWNFTGALRADAAPSLCLDRTSDKNGANVTARTCDGTTEQIWDYYF
jgi:hypothetical protein